ncbi:hypothetical protein F2P81_004231 [Scophthalmus maximus]|uniref:Uncharacterized protein n=1 Tax=Scophthalmus maximus TaxID=52904 RepID=A0A6A4TI22_SCOMX|nr:hypothetical protein F2P81_004231 [Scophthalmus maximus]
MVRLRIRSATSAPRTVPRLHRYSAQWRRRVQVRDRGPSIHISALDTVRHMDAVASKLSKSVEKVLELAHKSRPPSECGSATIELKPATAL